MRKLVAIDGNSLMHRAFHALPPMNSGDGTPTNAVFGFMNMLLKVIGDESPDGLLVAFDEHGPTFRHNEYAEYKAGRKATPDELKSQFPLIKELLNAMEITTVSRQGIEADDMLGIFCRRAELAGAEAVLVTGDRDALQLITEKTTVVLTKKGISETARMTPETLFEQYGMTPAQMIEVKGLMGDASDNIPGVPGVGEKTALKLITEFGTVEGVLKNIDNIKGAKLKERLTENAESARMSRRIGTILTDPDTDVGISLEQCAFSYDSMAKGRDMLKKLELRSLMNRLPKPDTTEAAADAPKEAQCKVLTLASADELSRIAEAFKKSKEVAVWLYDEKFSIADCAAEIAVLPVSAQVTLWDEANSVYSGVKAIAPALEAFPPAKTLYDAKQWLHIAGAEGVSINGADFDTMIAAYLIKPTRSAYSIKELYEEYGVRSLWPLRALMSEKLEALGLKKLFDEIEMPLVQVLYDMECDGFRVDADVLKELGARFKGEIDSLSAEIYGLAGQEFNILSPKQLGAVLFDDLKLPYTRKTKTGYSTDAETLEYLSPFHPIADKILKYRQFTKLQSTYIDGLLNAMGRDGKIRTSFKQTVTATGRISSTEPNLQNIPVRTELGREIRKAFIASEGCVLVGGDYSQIELRVLAHMANDVHMCEAFKSGEDIHRTTAANVFNVPLDQVTGEMRSAAKAVNFGIVYGISDFGLASNINVSPKVAKDYISAYLTKYSGVKAYMEKVVADAKNTGYVTTLFGRRRDVPELKSGNFNTRSFGERAAMNAPIQGTAADIIKLAMVRLHRALSDGGYRARLILQVHDELIVDTPKDEEEAVTKLVRDVMEGVIKLDVPLVADVKSGSSWYETK